MLKEEFEKRIGLVITCNEYAEIEKAYMADSVDKNMFVKNWIKNGGIQDLFDERGLIIQQLNNELKRAKDGAHLWCRIFEESTSELRVVKEKLEQVKKILVI